jgi:hypothetical protein
MLPAEIDIPQPEFNEPAEIAMLNRLRDNGQSLVDAYIAKETRQRVIYIARDAAKRVFPEYLADKTINNRASDRAASALADAARRTVLNRTVTPPRDIVMMVTGAPASGKTVASLMASAKSLEIVHETIITSLGKAELCIQQALDAGRRPLLHLFYTNDPRINVRRMISRARAIGRTVPLGYMARAYVEVPAFALHLSHAFSTALQLRVTDNSGARDAPNNHDDILRAVKETGRYTVNECLRCMDDELDKIHQDDPIPNDIRNEAIRR